MYLLPYHVFSHYTCKHCKSETTNPILILSCCSLKYKLLNPIYVIRKRDVIMTNLLIDNIDIMCIEIN